MSIKQNGGVFGRNPTFNDVTIEGQLTFDGDIDINSDLTVDGNLFVQNGDFTMTDTLPRLKMIDSDGTNQEFYFEESGGIGSITVRNGSNNGTLRLRANNGSTTTNTLEIDTSGNVKALVGNLVIGTSGKGIDFSATSGTGTSELLDDYEEGTWTPAFTGSDSGSITGFTVSDATYTKIGDTVRLSCYLSSINMTTSTVSGQIKIGGLPFSSDSFADVAAVTHCTMFSFDESTTSVSGYLSGSDVLLRKGSSTTAITDADESSLTTAQIMLSVTYKVA